jgi:uncharacterized membrane protein YfcA
MSFVEILGLLAAAAAAGAINAVAGGGTLVTFPTLLAFGIASKEANATSTLALVIGTAGSMYGYRRQMEPVRGWLVRFIPVSLVGAALGSWLLIRTSEAAFSRLVPFLILFATVLFFAQGAFKRFAAEHTAEAASAGSTTPDAGRNRPAVYRGVAVAIAFQFLVAVYGGYFGAGIGILMLASLGFIGLHDIHEMNALKTILSSLINLVAAVIFIFTPGLIRWPQAGVMTAGAFVGYYLGSHYSQKIPQARVRQLITVIGLGLSAMTFYKEFVK